MTVETNFVISIRDRADKSAPSVSSAAPLSDLAAADPAAADLLPLVYDELRRLAAHRLSGERHEHTLQPTALVHEAWIKLSDQHDRHWKGRNHFFAAAAEAMRRILVDRARRRQAAKRGAGAQRVDLEELDIPAPAPDEQLLAVNEALAKFAQVDPRKAELVKLRYFIDMTFEEAAEVLGIAVPTAKQWMAYARAWLRVELAAANPPEPRGCSDSP
jgi:RNA polymerase sigma factor (TIGR02999 family)